MKNTLTALIITLGFTTFSQVELLNESFTTGIPTTWSTIDADNNTVGSVQFIDAWIGYTSIFDTCAASTSYYLDANGNEDTLAMSSDYLITPQLSLLTFGNFLTWDAKSLDGSFPDGYVVLLSTTDNLEASFTDTLKIVSEESPYWTNYSVNMAEKGFANQDVYIAFKNNTTNGYVLQIDNVIVTADNPATINTNKIDLTVFPNPFKNQLNVNVEGFKNVEIYNMLGEMILTSNNSMLNTENILKGQYVAIIQTELAIFKIKLIK